MAQDFGDQSPNLNQWRRILATKRFEIADFSSEYFPPSRFFSFANHLISNIRCDKDKSGIPMFIAVPSELHLRYFPLG